MAEKDKHAGANAASCNKYKTAGRYELNKRRRIAKHERHGEKQSLKRKTPHGTARAARRVHLQKVAA